MALRTVVLAILVLTLLATPTRAMEPWRMVVRVTGKVESRASGVADWSPIWRSRTLKDGDFARTLHDSRATINLADQSQFTVGSDSVVEMTKFSLTPQGRVVLFNLQVGRIRAKVAKALGRDSTFQVTTPAGVMAARGTEFYVEQAPALDSAAPPALQGATCLIVFDGKVVVTTARGQRTFGPGDFGYLMRDGFIQYRPTDFNFHAPLGRASAGDAKMTQASGDGSGAGGTTASGTPGSPYQTDSSAAGQGGQQTQGTSSSSTVPPVYQPGGSPRATVPIQIHL